MGHNDLGWGTPMSLDTENLSHISYDKTWSQATENLTGQGMEDENTATHV